VERREWRGNSVDDRRRFGIIRHAALYAGHGPATAKLFIEMWNKDK
jgi:hypothetical protein